MPECKTMGYNNDVNQWGDAHAGGHMGDFPGRDFAGRDFHGAAIIAEDGTEVPITESMVSGALESMHKEWEAAHVSRDAAS